MMIQYIVVFENVFSYIEISPFYLFLYRGDIFHEHIALDKGISFGMRFETREDREEFISAKYSHNIILW